MFATLRIQARLRKTKTLHRFPANDVRVDYLVDVGFGDVAVPDSLRIDDHCWTVLALVETARLVGAHSAFQPKLRQLLLEEFLQSSLGGRITASSGMPRGTLVSADKNMLFKFRHQATVNVIIPAAIFVITSASYQFGPAH